MSHLSSPQEPEPNEKTEQILNEAREAVEDRKTLRREMRNFALSLTGVLLGFYALNTQIEAGLPKELFLGCFFLIWWFYRATLEAHKATLIGNNLFCVQDTDDPRAIGVLIEAFASTSVPSDREWIVERLAELLGNVTPADRSLFTKRDMRLLEQWIEGDSKSVSYGVYDAYLHSVLAAIRVLGMFGDESAYQFLQEYTEEWALTEWYETLLAEINEVLPEMEARLKAEEPERVLLRPSQASQAEELLRPASADSVIETRDLLRPAGE